MKSSSKQVVCTLVFLFSCIFAVSGQTDMKSRAEKPAVDATVKIQRAPGVPAPGIKGCLPPPVSSFNVRLQSLKTSGGSVYTRQLVTTADLPCFSTNTMLAATNIANCAEATAKKGLNSFSWENGACTAYLAWRPQKRADCKDGGSKVVYVVKTPLTPFEGGNNIVSGKMNYDALPIVSLDISHQYDICGFSTRINKGYKLQINGSEVVMLPGGKATYNISQKVLCSGGSMNLSLWSVGADGKVNSDEIQLTYNGSHNNYYGLQTGGCLYDAMLQKDYNGSLQYCNSINGTLYSAKVDGEARAFLTAMELKTDFPQTANTFYVGLKWVAEGQWEWLGGLALSNNDTVWDRPPSPGKHECGFAFTGAESWVIMKCDDCSEHGPVVCYFPNP